MWGVRSEWNSHLYVQHPISNAHGGDTKRYAFTCEICRQTFRTDGSLREDSYKRFFIFRNSHYADHMERIAWSVVKDYGPDSSAISGKRASKKHPKRRRRHKYVSGFTNVHDSSSSGRDEEAISGWSSEGSTGSPG